MRLVTTAALLAALAVTGSAFGAPPPLTAPTVGGCLRAWNAPSNAGSRQRLRAYSTWQASLSGGVVSSTVWTRGSRPRTTTSTACLLELARETDRLFVTGGWAAEGVARWKWGGVVSGQSMPSVRSNVRVLADGRIRARSR